MYVSQMVSDIEIMIKNNTKSFLFACNLSLSRWDWSQSTCEEKTDNEMICC